MKKKIIASLIVIAAIVSVVIFTGCVQEQPQTEDATEAPERHRVDQAPVLVPYYPSGQGGLKITDRQYDSSGLVSRTELFYFESTGESGEVQITARLEELETYTTRLEEQKMSITILVEAGKFYKLSVPFEGVFYGIVDEPRLIIESPALALPQVLQYKRIGVVGSWSMLLMLGKIHLEEWEPPAPSWGLTVKILSGEGTISADPGEGLLFSGESPSGYINLHSGYEDGTKVTLTAHPASGYVFDHWEGDVTGQSTSITVHMTCSRHIQAYFSKVEGN